jgi:hypothetical protein
MRILLTAFSLTLFFSIINGQEIIKPDTIFPLNGQSITCKVTKVGESEIEYSFLGEAVMNTVSKKQVSEIHFSSGRVQKISEKVLVLGEDDWQKVVLTTLPTDVTGLIKKELIRGKATGFTTLSNIDNIKSRAEEEIKRKAASQKCHVVLIQTYNERPGNYFTKTLPKVDINGVAYCYQ